MVTPYSYATCGYAGYATVTPNTVTPHGYATIASVLLRLRDGGATIFRFSASLTLTLALA